MAMQAGTVKNTPTTIFQMGNSDNGVCNRCDRAIEVGSKNVIQMSRENICKINLVIFFSPKRILNYIISFCT